ncbi:MAG: HAMP domain-containing histidine kinase [Lachnospiraceae bacterium]|nr:HAMP domain-containing histidine kinase [Candidatus Colinaster equi]
MKFKLKVILLNLGFIAVALSVFGLIIIYNSYKTSLDVETSHALKEHTVIISGIDYYVESNELPSCYSSKITQLYEAAIEHSPSASIANDSNIILIYDNTIIYDNREAAYAGKVNQDLTRMILTMSAGERKYMITDENGSHYIAVVSKWDTNSLTLVSMRNIDNIYDEITHNTLLLFCAMIIILIVCTILIDISCSRLTGPLENLSLLTDEISSGNYDLSIDVSSDDEIGELSNRFNLMTEAINNKINELNLSIKQREQFVADFTHEIKTPMTAIMGYADTLRSRNLDDEHRKIAYNYIFTEGKRLESMSMNLLDLLSLRNSDIETAKTHIADIFDAVVHSVTPILNDAMLTLSTHFEDCEIVCNRELICTVIINLIDNSRKASKENQTISLDGKLCDNEYQICVSDNGIGMSKSTINHIFDEFYKADKTRTRKDGGAGLGMSIALAIVKKHGGRIEIESTPEIGSSFYVYIPIDGCIMTGQNNEEHA